MSKKEIKEKEVENSYAPQWRELNTYYKVKLAPSKIEGVGVVALRDLKAGETLYADMIPKVYTLPYEHFDKIRPEIAREILGQWPQIYNGSNFMFPTTRIQAYMNHAPTNEHLNYDAINDVMLKDVKAGEEILEDYNAIPNADKIFAFLKD